MTAELFFTPTSTRTAITFALTSIPSSTPAPAELPPLIAPALVELEYATRGAPPLPHQLRYPSSHRPLHLPTLLLRFPHPNSPPRLQSAYVGLGGHPHRATPILAGIGTAVVRLGCTVVIRADVGVDCGAVHLRSLAERAEGRVLVGGRDGKGRCLINVSDAEWKDAEVVTVAKESVK